MSDVKQDQRPIHSLTSFHEARENAHRRVLPPTATAVITIKIPVQQ
jgi:hypothetical protein